MKRWLKSLRDPDLEKLQRRDKAKQGKRAAMIKGIVEVEAATEITIVKTEVDTKAAEAVTEENIAVTKVDIEVGIETSIKNRKLVLAILVQLYR